MLFVTSCTKTSIEPDSAPYVSDDSVATRSVTVEADITVAAFELIIDQGVMEFTGFDEDVDGLSIAPIQYINFTNASGVSVTVQANVTAFEIIIDDGSMEFTVPSGNYSGLDVAADQSLIFIE